MTPHGPPSLARHKLPVEFAGDLTIHARNGISSRWSQEQSIGIGAFGEVWLQANHSSGELRAVKRLPQVVHGVDFSRELVTLAALIDHDRLFVQFFGWYEDHARNFVYIAMEYIAGGDLSQHLQDPLVRCSAREITEQLLHGLAVMHELQICHRDIKPGNVLVVSLAPIWVKIADFGVSKLEQDTYLRTATGTVAYAAPELFGLLPRRLRPREVYSNAVDMWSLGCVVHEMLTAERPFLEEPRAGAPPPERQADVDMIIEFCRDLREFPDAAMVRARVGAAGTRFVKALLLPDPRLRLSAAEALASAWVSGEAVPDAGQITAMPGFVERLAGFVATNALDKFYPEISAELAASAESFATECIKRGCPRDIAASLEILVLYDIVLLISDHESMLSNDRIPLLQRLLAALARTYTLARRTGIASIRFVNASTAASHITPDTVSAVLSQHAYGGTTSVGPALTSKVLAQHVSGVAMGAPVLVVLVIDQLSDAQHDGVQAAVDACFAGLCADTASNGRGSVAFQVLQIGDSAAPRRVRGTQGYPRVGYCRVRAFDEEVGSAGYWIEITRVLLGAVVDNWA